MTRFLLVTLFVLISRAAEAQLAEDWLRLRQHAHDVGVDSLCVQPDSACVTRYFTEIVYGRTPFRMSYEGIPTTIDTVRINRLTHQFLAAVDWCPLLDSLESPDRRYPYWNVPRSITLNELLPKIRKNPAATLNAMNLQVIDAAGQEVDPKAINWATQVKAFPYRLRQSTGCDNALGVLKFNVSSPYNIYLHDTNARQAFERENRQLSHGCIRVEKPDLLANLLLGYVRFGADYLTSCAKNASPQTVLLPKKIPVIILYNVLDIDEEGAIRIYRDKYRL